MSKLVEIALEIALGCMALAVPAFASGVAVLIWLDVLEKLQ